MPEMPDQRSLYEQVSDLWRFARQQKMYDAQDWLATHWTGRALPWSLSACEDDDCAAAKPHTHDWPAIP